MDQWCTAGYAEIELARDPEKLGDTYYPRAAAISLQADPFSESFVSLTGLGLSGRLTRDEARQLRDHMTALLALDEDDGRSHAGTPSAPNA